MVFQLSSLNKHRDDQDTKEANSFQFKNAIETRLVNITLTRVVGMISRVE